MNHCLQRFLFYLKSKMKRKTKIKINVKKRKRLLTEILTAKIHLVLNNKKNIYIQEVEDTV